MRVRLILGAVALCASACSPKPADTAAAPAQEGAPVEAVAEAAPSSAGPSDYMRQTFADCTWGEVSAAGFTIGSFACPNTKLAPDESLPGFQKEFTDADGKVTRFPAIQVFRKALDNSVPDAVIADVRAASPGPFTASCVLEPSSSDPSGKTYVLVPTGAGKAAHEAFLAGTSEENSMPCGQMGPSEAGERVFRLVDGAPDKVVYIDLGSEIQIFDTKTLRPSK
jgi:hypothetical protein